ncbi:membrane protein insertion efficiency factor YidD [Campylobacter geochelonis]|uniref:membrane protein insertion efficiency factor YidD n=1 Tax=Campylobacter geochelonis TaxID=1780362 RepID=UPI0009E3A9CC|nr:membrane protein insertion efficiency factor YidD [Campylobacter geochelonis]QKF71554.1 membrane protein insertion efficiency factor, YidD family [Campylobacter geochelonis]
MKKLSLKLIKIYQIYISPALPKSCRYYPTCSEYAVWHFKNSSFFRAFFATFFRILRCNQLFKGGIDYPVTKKSFSKTDIFSSQRVIRPKFWFIPFKNGNFYIIKSLDFKKEK